MIGRMEPMTRRRATATEDVLYHNCVLNVMGGDCIDQYHCDAGLVNLAGLVACPQARSCKNTRHFDGAAILWTHASSADCQERPRK